MPEVVELRVISDEISPIIKGKIILDIQLKSRAKHKNLDNLKDPIEIINVTSYGKKLIWVLENKLFLVFSLGMEGRIIFKEDTHSNIKFTIKSKDDIDCSSLIELFYDDFRYMGNVAFYNMQELTSVLSELGPEILVNDIDPGHWLKIFRSVGPRKKICPFLLDQSVVAGIGNYLKSEILYYAMIKPDRTVKSLSDYEIELLRQVTHWVARTSYTYGGTTLKSFWSPNGNRGAYPCAVYKQKSDKYGNEVIKSKFTDGRSTYWCPNVQK